MNGLRLKEIRKSKGMTLDMLAEKLCTSKQTISRYEKGVITNVPHDKVLKLAQALGIDPGELMDWDRTENENEVKRENIFISYKNVDPITYKKLPLLGEIACGQPMFAEEEYESFVTVPGCSADADFCLRAHGDSMTGARINDGDLVFIRSQETVDNGDIAAVIINDEATLKRVYFYPEDGKLILSPENPRYAPLVYLGEELNTIKIIGKAIAFQSTVI